MTEPEPSSEPISERDIFLQALDIANAQERSVFLERVCRGNESLRAAVEDLLRHHLDDAFLETPMINREQMEKAFPNNAHGNKEVNTLVDTAAGERVGPYKLLQKIGEGGCGVVYMAEQEEPIRRRVALKVIKLGMDTKNVIARFEAERQALALMDHPCIARVLDAGATQAGRPYFVMDLVRGIKITEYCDQNNLTPEERLGLFIHVCQAIQHAHQKGIIHRDIKPSNILVTLHDSVPVPKIIDFGVAKAIGQRLTDKTVFTEFQAFVGTPAYTSPEQAEMSGLDIDTRSDIYSLGVLLYELLTGVTPFDAEKLAASGLDQMRRTIREEEPVVPSTRIATMLDEQRTSMARSRKSDPSRLASLFRGDLDWIVMKALEKDRTRRYATTNELAQDVQRYLNSEPVLARPPSSLYRFEKWVRRNKLPFAVATASTSALVIGLIIAGWQFIQKNQAYDKLLIAEHEQRLLHQKAEESRANEAQLRRTAENQELASRRRAYAADINLIAQALAANNLGRARQLLDQQRPMDSEKDVRGWEWRYLWERCQSDALFTLCNLPNEINNITTSYDGRWAAIGDDNGGLWVWDLRTRREHVQFPKIDGPVIAAFSPTEPLLAFAGTGFFGRRESRSQSLRIWNVNEGKVVFESQVGRACDGLIFSQNGEHLLIVSGERVTVLDVHEGSQLTTVSIPGYQAFRTGMTLATTPDLSMVAYAMKEGEIRVMNLDQGRELWKAQAADEQVTALRFSPDGKILVSGAGFVESAIRVWDVEKGTSIARLEGHQTWVTSLLFWPDGRTLASASGDQTIKLWDMSVFLTLPGNSSAMEPSIQKNQIAQGFSSTTLKGHKFEVWAMSLLPDQATLLSGSKDGSVLVWDTTMAVRERSHVILPTQARTWQFSDDSDALLTMEQDGRIIRWEGPDFQEKTQILALEHSRFGGVFSDNGKWLAMPDMQKGIQVYDLEQGGLHRTLQSESALGFPVGFGTRDGSEFLFWLRRSRELRSSLYTLDLEDNSQSPLKIDVQSAGYDMVLSPGGDFLMAHHSEGLSELWDLKSNTKRTFEFNEPQIFEVAFSPDGKYFAGISRTAHCELWDVETLTHKVTLRGFLQAMNSVVFSSDSDRLAIGGNGTEAVKIWDVESFREMLTLKGQGSLFRSIAFSPDGNRIAACNREGLLHVWSAPSFDQIKQIEARL